MGKGFEERIEEKTEKRTEERTEGAETFRYAEEILDKQEREAAVEALHERLAGGTAGDEELEELLWRTVLAFQGYPFYTSSGLPFSYTVKCRKDGTYSGELLVSRKEESKTLTRSSVMLAFHIVQKELGTKELSDERRNLRTVPVPTEYKGPKAIGQIFGISYIYSLFWRWGLIRVPEKVETKLRGEK